MEENTESLETTTIIEHINKIIKFMDRDESKMSNFSY